jgi:PAS domain S-box-containing protein
MHTDVLNIIVSYKENVYFDVNGNFLRFSRYNRNELVGKSMDEIPIFSNYNHKELIEKLKNDKEFEKKFDIELITKSKEIKLGLCFLQLLKINSTKYLLYSILDYTDKIKKEEENILRRTKSEAIIEHAFVGIVTSNNKGIITSVNNSILKLFEYSKEELIGKSVNILMENNYASNHDKYIDKYQETKHKTLLDSRREVLAKKKDGKTFPVYISITEYSIKNQQHFAAIFEDLTELKNIQDKLILSEKLASLGHLVTSVAHEINSPLGAIRASNELIIDTIDFLFNNIKILLSLPENTIDKTIEIFNLIKQKSSYNTTNDDNILIKKITKQIDKIGIENPELVASKFIEIGLDTDIQKYAKFIYENKDSELYDLISQVSTLTKSIDIIDKSVGRANNTIFALKNYARYDNISDPINYVVEDSIDTVLVLYQNIFKKGVKLNKEFKYKKPIKCYPDDLNQVWINLIYNALQAMDFNGEITIKTKKVKEYLMISIKDNGKGIPDVIKDKIFNPFFTTKKQGEGSGIGLDIVLKIIEKHKGRIEFDSEINVGTEFRIYLSLFL